MRREGAVEEHEEEVAAGYKEEAAVDEQNGGVRAEFGGLIS